MSEWKTVKLSDICTLEKGQQIDTTLLDDSKPYRYINGGIKESGYFDNFNTSGESVLISEGGASCGFINYVNERFWCGCHCYRLHDIKVFPKYLFHALKANQQRIMALRTGSAMPNIQKSTIQKFELKIHDDSTTQKKVSTMLDKCDELIEKHKQTLEKYDNLIKSRFIEMFGDPVQNSKGYKYKKLEELGKWESGGTPSRKNNDYFKGSIPWYSAGELNSLYLYDSNEKITETAIEESSAKLFRKGSLFVGMYDTAAFKMGIATTDCSSNQACANIFPNRDVNVIWLYYELMEMKEFFLQNRRGVRQKNLNLGMIKGFEIPYAPSNLQNDFAAFVQQIDKSKFAVQKSLEKAETLYKSLMQEYFG